MKYLLITTLLLTGCCFSNNSTKPKPNPKFKVGQELKVTEGFYRNAQYFVPEKARLGYCDHTDYTVWIYNGFVYVDGLGRIEDLSFCEKDLVE